MRHTFLHSRTSHTLVTVTLYFAGGGVLPRPLPRDRSCP
jgi:hypothetical protein